MRRLPREGCRCGRPCRRRSSFCRFAPPSPPAGGPVSLAPRLADPRPCCRAPPHGGAAGRARAPGRSRGAWGKGRPAGGRKLRFEGRPGRRGRGGASRLVSWRRVRGESRPARCRGERLSGCRPRRSVGACWLRVRLRGARPAPPSSGKACVGGKLPGCQGGRLGVESNPCARPGVAVGAPVGVSPPRCPEARPPFRRGLGPPLFPPRGVKVACRPPPLLLHLSARGRRRRVSGVGPVLILRFSPGVGRRLVSRRSPLAWSPSRRFTVLRPRPRGSGVVSPSPRRCASLARVLGGGPAAAPARP